MLKIELNEPNLKIVFGEHIENGENMSSHIIFGDTVTVKNLYVNGADGIDDSGNAWACCYDFGLYAKDNMIGRCENKIGNIEQAIPIEERANEFIRLHQKGNMYSVNDFCRWTRRLVNACYGGREAFLRENNLNEYDMCTTSFYLSVIKKDKITNSLMPEKIKEYYKDEEKKYETANPCSPIQ